MLNQNRLRIYPCNDSCHKLSHNPLYVSVPRNVSDKWERSSGCVPTTLELVLGTQQSMPRTRHNPLFLRLLLAGIRDGQHCCWEPIGWNMDLLESRMLLCLILFCARNKFFTSGTLEEVPQGGACGHILTDTKGEA